MDISMAKRILIADDDAAIAELLASTFSQEGYETTKATESLRFFDAVRAAQPDLILLDLRMPYLNGEDELRLMGMFPEIANTPVIVVTADPDAKPNEAHYRALGVSEVVTKPFNLNDLIKLVHDTIGEPREVIR
jgi:DNA-binding response OmpR family regulator